MAFARREKRRACESSLTWKTARLMTACGGDFRKTSCAALQSRMASSRPRFSGNGFSMKVLMISRSWPLRRRAVAAIALAKARSRGSSPAKCSSDASRSNASSSGRFCASTSVTRLTAMRRALSPARSWALKRSSFGANSNDSNTSQPVCWIGICRDKELGSQDLFYFVEFAALTVTAQLHGP